MCAHKCVYFILLTNVRNSHGFQRYWVYVSCGSRERKRLWHAENILTTAETMAPAVVMFYRVSDGQRSSASGFVDTTWPWKYVEVTRYRREYTRLASSPSLANVDGQVSGQQHQPPFAGLRPSVPRRLLVAVDDRQQLAVGQSAAVRPGDRGVASHDGVPVVVECRRSGRRLVQRKRLRHRDQSADNRDGAHKQPPHVPCYSQRGSTSAYHRRPGSLRRVNSSLSVQCATWFSINVKKLPFYNNV